MNFQDPSVHGSKVLVSIKKCDEHRTSQKHNEKDEH